MNRFISVFLCLFTLFVIARCGDEGPDIDTESAIPVGVETIARKAIKEYLSATGTVVATKDADLVAQQSGYYYLLKNPRTSKPYAMGDHVQAGETIVKLENQEFENQVTIESKKLNLDISKREYDKQKSLYEKGGVTLLELTNAERAYIDASYAYENAKLQLAKLRHVAPFSGYLVDLPFYPEGKLVETGRRIVQVADYSNLYCEVVLPGKELGRIKTGQEVEVVNYTVPDDTLLGEVVQVSPAVDPTSRMFKAGIAVDNRTLLLRPGMFVKADIVVESRDSAVVIPRDVVLRRSDGKVVFIVEKGIAVERKIRTGLSGRDEIEVTAGVNVDERLVVRGFETLRNRSRVKILK